MRDRKAAPRRDCPPLATVLDHRSACPDIVTLLSRLAGAHESYTDRLTRTLADRNRARRLRRRTALPVPATPHGESEGQKDREHPTRHRPILNSRGSPDQRFMRA
jgi:hypothetical protein